MNRRAFFARLWPASAAVALPAAISVSAPELPYERQPAICSTCGDQMLIVTRSRERPSHDAAVVWTCFRCQTSWRIGPQRIAADRVAYDDGVRDTDRMWQESATEIWHRRTRP
jgi:hypothetical protein